MLCICLQRWKLFPVSLMKNFKRVHLCMEFEILKKNVVLDKKFQKNLVFNKFTKIIGLLNKLAL